MIKLLRPFFRRQVRRCANVASNAPTKNSLCLPENLTCSELESGIKVISTKERSNLARVVMVLNAGPRFEEPSEVGVTHLYRHVLFGSNAYHTNVTNSRALYQIGSDISVECTRDNVIVKSTFGSRYLFNVLDFIGSSVSYHKGYYWEVMYALQSCLIDLDNLNSNLIPERLIEELHCKMFRQGYGNSLYVRPDCESTLRETPFLNYLAKNVCSNRCVIAVQSDLSHPFVEEYVEAAFHLRKGANPSNPAVKTFSGETVIREELRYYHTLVGYPAPSENHSSWATFAVLQKYLGGVVQCKPTSFSTSRLGAVFEKAYPAKRVSSLYMAHNHTGVFGFYAICERKDYARNLEEVCRNISTVMREKVDPQQLQKAINQATFELADRYSHPTNFLSDIATHVASFGAMPSFDEKISKLRKVTEKDLQAEMMRLLSTRPVVVSLGNPSYIPSSDEIASWLSKK